MSPKLEETLAKVPLFARLKPRELERLAKRMSERRWSEGDVVITEGKGGIGFWVIEDGNATVSVRGKSVGSLGPGDHFGEIALLRDVPRTATVTARTDASFLALERDEFVSAVSGHPVSREAADAVVAERLGRLRPGLASI